MKIWREVKMKIEDLLFWQKVSEMSHMKKRKLVICLSCKLVHRDNNKSCCPACGAREIGELK